MTAYVGLIAHNFVDNGKIEELWNGIPGLVKKDTGLYGDFDFLGLF